MKIGALIFDVDGVLVDAREWHYEALNRALALFGHGITRHEHLVTYDGLPTRKKLEMLTLERGLPRGLHPFINELKQVYTMELIESRCKPVFQHQYALSKLKARGYRIGVASNSVRNSVEAMMARSKLAGYLDVMLSNEDVSKPKPDPEMYLVAAARLGIEPSACVIVEDNPNGVAAARAAGGNVMVVRDVVEVTLDNIQRAIDRAEGRGG